MPIRLKIKLWMARKMFYTGAAWLKEEGIKHPAQDIVATMAKKEREA